MNLSFKQFLLEYQFDIPETDYGYWIDHDGRFLVVNDEAAHGEVAARYSFYGKEESDYKQYASVYQFVYAQGWIRIVDTTSYKGNVVIAIKFHKKDPKPYQSALRFLSDRADKYMNDQVEIVIENAKHGEGFDNFVAAKRYFAMLS